MMTTKNNYKNRNTPKSNKQHTDPAKSPAEPTNGPQGLTVVGISTSAGGFNADRSSTGSLPKLAWLLLEHRQLQRNGVLVPILAYRPANVNWRLMHIKHRLNLMACHPQVRSKPGKGTRVLIDIPIKQGTT
jgi:hypothetical protein